MHLLLGNSHIESGDYNSAVRSFEHARAQMRPHTSPELLQVSLVSLLPTIQQCTKFDCYLRQISGWQFDNLGTAIQRQLCEALYAVGHTKRAGEAVLEIANPFGDGMYTSDGLSEWTFGKFIHHAYGCHAYKTSPQPSCNVVLPLQTARAIQPLSRLETIFLHHSAHRSPHRY